MELTSNLEHRRLEMEHRQSINFRLYGELKVAGSIHKGGDEKRRFTGGHGSK